MEVDHDHYHNHVSSVHMVTIWTTYAAKCKIHGGCKRVFHQYFHHQCDDKKKRYSFSLLTLETYSTCSHRFVLQNGQNGGGIDLVTVFDAILTSRQPREKLQCLYENLMSNNFYKTAVLNKISIVN